MEYELLEEWQTISFNEMCYAWPLADRSCYVYRMWDWDLECVYIGSTTWLRKRGNGHYARARWPLSAIHLIDVCQYPDRETMLAAERYWFDRLTPVFNELRPRITPEERRGMWSENYHHWYYGRTEAAMRRRGRQAGR